MDIDAAPESPPKDPIRYEKLWIPDGNVVLATDSHLFRVHKSVLSMQSSAFRDMFELAVVGNTRATSNDAGMAPEMYDGVPLVRLVGDEGEDVVHLLRTAVRAIMRDLMADMLTVTLLCRYYRTDNDNTPLEVITALLLLSTKYDFKHIRRDVVAHISRHYPTTFAACDAIEGYKSKMFGHTRTFAHFALLKALHATRVDALLPAAYYACAGNASRVFRENATFLGLECFTTLTLGRLDLTTEMSELVAKIPGELLDKSGFYECHKEKQRIKFHDLDYCIDTGDIKYLEGSGVLNISVEGICDKCESKLITLIDEKRRKIWEKIPGYFGSKVGWDALQAKLDEMLAPEE